MGSGTIVKHKEYEYYVSNDHISGYEYEISNFYVSINIRSNIYNGLIHHENIT
jgi:hypothetical protein